MPEVADAVAGREWDPPHAYAHFPFCSRKCPYCDFNSYAGRESEIDAYLDAMLAEARQRLPGSGVQTLYVGGGTPTLCDASRLERYLTALREAYGPGPVDEFTVEANPGTLDSEKVKALRRAGVNRVSLGAQTFHSPALRGLGRIHDAPAIARSADLLRSGGVGRISLDLMLALPGQDLGQQARDVSRVVALGPEHVSAYVLTIEEGTPFARDLAAGRLPAPHADRELSRLRVIRTQLEEAGLSRYEISNFSHPGGSCRHNLGYWRGEDWVGLGAGAHSHRGPRRWKNIDDPARYAHEMRTRGDGTEWVETAPPEVMLFETLLMGLRLVEGVDLRQTCERTGLDVRETYGPVLAELESWALVELDATRLRATDRGLEVLSAILARLVPKERPVSGNHLTPSAMPSGSVPRRTADPWGRAGTGRAARHLEGS